MSKRKGLSLEELVAGVGGGDPVTPPPPTETPIGATTSDQVVPVSTLMAPADRLRIRQLALEGNTSVQQLGIAAWSMLLEARGLPPIGPAKANVPSGRTKR